MPGTPGLDPENAQTEHRLSAECDGQRFFQGHEQEVEKQGCEPGSQHPRPAPGLQHPEATLELAPGFLEVGHKLHWAAALGRCSGVD